MNLYDNVTFIHKEDDKYICTYVEGVYIYPYGDSTFTNGPQKIFDEDVVDIYVPRNIAEENNLIVNQSDYVIVEQKVESINSQKDITKYKEHYKISHVSKYYSNTNLDNLVLRCV